MLQRLIPSNLNPIACICDARRSDAALQPICRVMRGRGVRVRIQMQTVFGHEMSGVVRQLAHLDAHVLNRLEDVLQEQRK